MLLEVRWRGSEKMISGLTEMVGDVEIDSQIFCKETLQEVLQSYPEINRDNLSIRIDIQKNPEFIEGYALKGTDFLSSRGYSICGIIPQRAINDGYSQKLVKTILSHEFAHIVNGDLDGLGILIHALNPLTNNMLLRWRERKADREVIRRGFGKDLYESCSYVESIKGKRPHHYYSTSQIAELLTKISSGGEVR